MDAGTNNAEEVEMDEKGILYEFITYAEWSQEAELMVKNEMFTWRGKRNQVFLNSFWSKLSSLTGCLSPDIIHMNNSRLAWQIAVAADGKAVAILQDNTFEIRLSKDDYSIVVGTNTVKKDPYPHWRRIAWSPNANFLAVSYSDGSVDCFDSAGIRLFSVNSVESSGNDLGEAAVDILFIDTRVKADSMWAYELILINYKGQLRSYFISRLEHELGHTFSFKQAVSAVVYHLKFNVLICCGQVDGLYNSESEDNWNAGRCGISTWRLLNNAPYYRQSLTIDQELNEENKSRFFQHISRRVLGRRSKDEIYKIVLSPNGNYLVAVHVSSTITVWNVPSMRLWKKWTLDDQPKHQQEVSTFGEKRKIKPDSNLLKNHVNDLSWWSDKALILGRFNGSVSVSSTVSNLKNLLGGSVEWFESQPQLTSVFDNRFLVLECEHQVVSRRPPSANDSSTEEPQKVENSSDDETESSSSMIKSALFYITDSERFRPLRKKPKLTTKIYRLICLKSTTPEELFLSKLDDEQFGEALSLAKSYGLDSDLVYQRQWRNSGFSLIAIQDYLSKITKRSWVLKECLERVPEDVDSMRALLQFGIQGTDINVLVNMGKGLDSGKFISDITDPVGDDDVDNALDDDELLAKRTNMRQKLLNELDFSYLTMDQKHLCLCRMKLLQYLDRLTTYEVMLGGPAYSFDNYDAKFFTIFRSQPAVEATIQFARQSNWQGVSAMFTYHGKETLPHRLAILSNFPETTSPFVYRSLLPEAGFYEDEFSVFKWEEERIRSPDWIESASCIESCGFKTQEEVAALLYEERPSLSKFINFEKTQQLLSTWYIERALEIEENCRLVNYAQELLRLGIERNVPNLEDLYDELVTMEVLVYECQIGDSMTLKQLQSMSDMEKLSLLLSNSTNDNIVKNMKLWAIPFLSRCEKKSPGVSQDLIRKYMINLAIQKLDACANIFRSSPYQQHFIAQTTSEFLTLALDCIYSCEEDQFESAIIIFECLPHRGFGIISKDLQMLYDKVNKLENHLNAATILKKHNVSKSIAFINRCETDEHEVKNILTLLTRVAFRKESLFGELDFKEMLEDVLKLQSTVFYCVDVNFCFEIFAESLLSSGRSDYINLASCLLKGQSHGQPKSQSSMALHSLLSHQQTIPRERAIYLVISSAKEYFNSSTEMDDPIMDLARQCLKIIDDPGENVLSELDLIDSLRILKQLGIEMLPLQVRMCANRMDLIRQVFDIDPSAYRESQKLMTLAHYLRVGQNVKHWEEQVLILIAKAAFKANDHVACYNACHQIMDHKYSNGWEVCFDLGRCELFDNITCRCDLLNFSAVFCSTDQLEYVLNVKLSLYGYLIKQSMERQLDLMKETLKQGSPESEKNVYVGSGGLTTQIHNLTTSTTKQALSLITGSKIVKDASSWLRHLGQEQSSTGEEDIINFNIMFSKLSVPTFYSSCFPDSLESPLSATYRSYAIPSEISTLSISLQLMSLVYLTWNDESNDNLSLSPTVIQQIAVKLLPLDTLLGLACLMTLSDPEMIDECFKSLPNTDTCVELAIYLFSLRICHLAGLVSKVKLYDTDSETLCKRAERYARLHFETVEDIQLKQYCVLLQNYLKKREDFVQAKMLLSLGRGVDVVRFACDELYRFETVLGLVMTTDDKVFKMALSLAERYEVNKWEILMTHLEYLFNEDDLKLSALEQRVAKLELIPKLLNDVEKFKERMETRVYTTISGIDHNRLHYFYSLVKQCNPEARDERFTLLKKLKSVAKGIDFKALVSGQSDVLSVVKPVLTSANVKHFVKLAPQISKCCCQELTSSGLYRILALKSFQESDQDIDVSKKVIDWIWLYNISKNYFEFLDPNDFVKFLDEALFSEESFDQISQDSRIDILNRSHKFAKQSLNRSKDDNVSKIEWEEAVNFVNRAMNHINWLKSEAISDLIANGDDIIKGFLQELRTAYSNDRLKVILLRNVIKGHPGEILHKLVAVCPESSLFQINDLIREAFTFVLAYLSGQNSQYDHLLVGTDVVDIVKKMLDGVRLSQVKVVPFDEITKQLESVYTNDSIITSVRLKLIDVIEAVYENNDEKFNSIRNYKLQLMIADTWPAHKILNDIFHCDETKKQLLNALLANSQTLEQGECLVKILLSWPTLDTEHSSNISINPWCRIMRLMLSTRTKGNLDAIINCLRAIKNRSIIEIEGIEPIFNEMNEYGSLLHTLKFCLLTKHKKLHRQILRSLKDYTDNVLELDDETCDLLIENELVPETLTTVLYRPLVDYILKHKDAAYVKKLAADLQQNGYPSEAASLLMKLTGTPRGLQTFSSALGLLKRWL